MTWRDYVPSIDLRKWLRSGGRTGARLASITAFVVLLGLTVFAAFTAGSVVIAALATFVLFFMLRAALPAERIDTFVSDLLSGEAGVQWYSGSSTSGPHSADGSPDDPLTARYYSIVTTGSVEMLFSDIFKTETAGRSRLRIAWYSRKNRSQPNSISWYVHIYLCG